MSEPYDASRLGSLGGRRGPFASSVVGLIAGFSLAAGFGMRFGTPEPSVQQRTGPPGAGHVAGMLCGAFDSAHAAVGADSGATARALKARKDDCHLQAQRIARLRAASQELITIHWMIPEYHDQQMLRSGKIDPSNPLDPAATTFGPIVSAYAVPQVNGYEYVSQIEGQEPPGALVAYILVDNYPGTLPSSYTRLNLNKGLNCVWLSHSAGAPDHTGWSGRIAPAKGDTLCDRNAALATNALDVVRESVSGNHRDYPAVVRFDEGTIPEAGEIHAQPLLGTRCAAGWCTMGPTGFTPQPIPAQLAGLSGPRESRIRGYFDDNWLSDDNTHRPLLRAAIVPEHKLDALSVKDFSRQKHVATIFLFTPPPQNSSYYHIGLRSGRNKVWLQENAGGWTSWIDQGSPGSRTTWNIIRTTHNDEAIPGTARFRWSNSPNDGWTPCGAACCQEYGPFP